MSACVSVSGVWSREQFFEWCAEYLQWLWHHDDDRSLPRLALGALQPLLDFSPEVGGWVGCEWVGKSTHLSLLLLQLGLSVLLVRPSPSPSSSHHSSASSSSSSSSRGQQQLSFGGRGVGISEVLKLLRAVTVPSSSPSSGQTQGRSVLLRKAAGSGGSNGIAASVLQATPLLSGHLLAAAFLGRDCILHCTVLYL